MRQWIRPLRNTQYAIPPDRTPVQPQHEVATMPAVTEGRIAIFGAGGPVGAAAARALREHYTLRLTDVRPIAEIAAAGKPQSPGAPLPEALPPPHECRTVDV